ncbi:MAG: hypothetical protein ACLQGP_37090 [Isosphaeraceae bacterium]
MRPFGFSTGALALGDFGLALKMLDGIDVAAIELSALRLRELPGLVAFVRHADLTRFSYVSVHAPTDYDGARETDVVDRLIDFAEKGWPIVAHPDVIRDHSPWKQLGSLLCIENLDKRKPVGRTVGELERIFDRLPDARMCFDIGHARQVDTSMTEAYRLAKTFRDKIAQIHISVVNSSSKHDLLSPNAAHAFHQVAYLIPPEIPAILEMPARREQLRQQLDLAAASLDGALSDDSHRKAGQAFQPDWPSELIGKA